MSDKTISNEEREELLDLFVSADQLNDKCQPLYAKYAALETKKEELLNSATKKYMWIIVGLCLVTIGLFAKFGARYLLINLLVCAALIFAGIRVIESMKQKVKAEVREIKQEQKPLLEEIDEIYLSSDLKGKYPQKYLFEEAIEYCYSVVEDMRADSVKEAINLYEDELYKTRLEAMQRSAEKAQREAAESLRNIEAEAGKTRKAAQFAAVASGISAYNTHKIKKRIG